MNMSLELGYAFLHVFHVMQQAVRRRRNDTTEISSTQPDATQPDVVLLEDNGITSEPLERYSILTREKMLFVHDKRSSDTPLTK
jgi:hypothetical protein